MSDTPTEERAEEQAAEAAVAVEERGREGEVVAEQAVGIEPLAAPGPAPVTNWQSWNSQQGGIQPTTVNPQTQPGGWPPSTGGGTPGTMFPGILPQTATIQGSLSTPVYDDTPTYRKPADPYQGWTAQVPNFMVVQPYPPPAVQISGVFPRHGAASTAVNVQIQGLGFTGAVAGGVTIGGAAITNFVLVSDTIITCTTAATLVAGAYSAVVTSPKGTATLPNAYITP